MEEYKFTYHGHAVTLQNQEQGWRATSIVNQANGDRLAPSAVYDTDRDIAETRAQVTIDRLLSQR